MKLQEDIKQEYQEKAQTKLDRLNAQIDELKLQTELAKADAKVEYQEKLNQLYRRRDKAQLKLKQLQQSSEQAWSEMKKGFEAALSELSTAWNNAQSKF